MRTTQGYLGPHRHVDDLLEAAERLLLTAGNTAALFDGALERHCDQALVYVREVRANTLRRYQEAIDGG